MMRTAKDRRTRWQKGSLVVEVLKRRVVSRTHRRQPGDEEMLVVIRYRDRDQQEVVKVDYYLSNAGSETPLWSLPGGQSRASHRRMYPEKQERSGFGGL